MIRDDDGRFPRPWRSLKLKDSFQVQDADGYPVAYVYFAENQRVRELTHRMSEDEALGVVQGIIDSASREKPEQADQWGTGHEPRACP